MEDTPLIIGSRTFNSRLLVGTGKYKDLTETDLAIQASGAELQPPQKVIVCDG